MHTDALKAIMPNCDRPDLWADILGQTLEEAEATTVPRAAALLAQLAHESGECKWLEELANGSTYESRLDLGNTRVGDGRRYKGRGLIQLTGRANYRQAGAAIGIDLELHPEEASKPRIAGRVAAWYWRTRGCNDLADNFDFEGVTRAINGGLNGIQHRQKYYLRALQALGTRRAACGMG